jgi:RimJ/RimL family protein N-acetyltransferase
VLHPIGRFRRALRRYGVRGTATRLGELAVQQMSFDQAHVWYELPLAEPRPRVQLDPAFELRRAAPDDLRLLDALWAIDHGAARRRLDEGGTLWLVLDGDRPVFSCWIFSGRTPIRAAQGGWLDLPDDTLCLEESLTDADYRGRGIAPATWSTIAGELEGKAVRRIVTTIEEENVASRRAVEKVGFHEIGMARTRRRALRTSVTVVPGAGADAAFLQGLVR